VSFKKKSLYVGLIACLTSSGVQADVGLGTQFADAVLEGLEPGGTYNLRELRGIPYSVSNIGNAEVQVQIEVVPPKPKEIKDEYEPVPDPNWIRLQPERHRIPPGGMAFSDIIITLPDDPSLVGRHFQAFIKTSTLDTGLLAAGLKTQIRFSVGPGPESLAKEKQKKAMVTLNFDIWPSGLYVLNAPAGQKYDVKQAEKKSLSVTNRADKLLDIEMKAASWDTAMVGLPEGYEPGNPEWIAFVPSRVKVKPQRVQEVKTVLNVPADQKGKKLAFLVQACLPIGTVVSSSNRVFVTVADGEALPK
jgi:hypothetical protein